MRIKSLLSTCLIIAGATALILSYQSQSGTKRASADNGVSRSKIVGEIYYNTTVNSEPDEVQECTLYKSNSVTTKYIVGEVELVGLAVSDLEIKEPKYSFTDKEIEVLQRLVEAECTDQDIEPKKNVCSVVINRVYSDSFPDSIKEVVFENSQFSCIGDKRYYEVKITKDTIEAVNDVVTNGTTTDALYFFNMKDVKSPKIKRWINNKLKFLFKDDSGHSFYTE